MSTEPEVRALMDADVGWAEGLLHDQLGGRIQARRGELVDVLDGPALVAWFGHRPAGIVAWHLDESGAMAEVRVLLVDSDVRGQSVGRALIDAAADWLRDAGARRAWLVTTNDNLAALALYQKAGWRLTALRTGAIDDLRRTIKPSISEIGEHGIPLRDELELELELQLQLQLQSEP